MQPQAVRDLQRGGKGSLTKLSGVTLGRTLDKTEQCSNWDRRPLKPSQLAYAALDAEVLVRIFEKQAAMAE